MNPVSDISAHPIQNPTSILQSGLQMGLMSSFQTGNPMLDPIIHIIVYSLIGTFFMNIQKFFDFSNIQYYFGRMFSYFSYFYYKYIRKTPEIIKKEITINYITDKKKVNHLYTAIDWYISNKLDIDFIKETPLDASFDTEPERIGSTNLDKVETTVRIGQNRWKSFEYNGKEIFYLCSKGLITVYGDQERKKENHNINLYTLMNKDEETDVLKEFCDHGMREYIKTKNPQHWVQKIYVNNKEGKWVSQDSNNRRKLETVVLDGNRLEEFKSDLDCFLKSEEWYHNLGISYTRGYLLYGYPGTGKTSLIKGLSTYTKRHMHYLILQNVKSDEQLLELLRDIDYRSTILIIEDIDCVSKVTEKRKDEIKSDVKDELNKIKEEIMEKLDKKSPRIDHVEFKSELTLSGLLNGIDGIFSNDGRIMIMTTNRPQVLDEALIRPGRIDKKIFFDMASNEQIKNIYRMMFEKDMGDKIDLFKDRKYSPAAISSFFLQYRSNPDELFDNMTKLDENNIFIDNRFFSEHILKPKEPTMSNTAYCADFSLSGQSFQSTQGAYNSRMG